MVVTVVSRMVQAKVQKSPRGQKWRSAAARPERRTRAQSATHEPRPALARGHAAHDPARITAQQSPIAQHGTASCIQHLAQQHTFCTLQHPPPAFGWRHPASSGDRSKGHVRMCSCARNHRPAAATVEHEAQHETTCARSGPTYAPKARGSPRAGASASTRRRLGQPRPRLRPQHALRAADGPRKRAAARHAMTLHPSALCRTRA
jgi:hypothetical protein